MPSAQALKIVNIIFSDTSYLIIESFWQTFIFIGTMFSTASQFEDEDDLVNNCLCKLQDGLKVKPGEATEALRQYGRFRAEMDRLQQRLERPSVSNFVVLYVFSSIFYWNLY